MSQIMNRLQVAMNAHDLDAFVACFAADYESEQPAHPGMGVASTTWSRRRTVPRTNELASQNWARGRASESEALPCSRIQVTMHP